MFYPSIFDTGLVRNEKVVYNVLYYNSISLSSQCRRIIPMKKSNTASLLFVTAIFCAFLVGLFVGRNYNHSDIQVTNLSRSEPLLSDVQRKHSETEASAEEVARVDLNSASFDVLCTLPGIGEVLAHRIIQYR